MHDLCLVWATVDMEYPRLGSLVNRNLFLTLLEAGKSKVKAPAGSVSGESPPPGLQMAAFLW